MKKRFRCEVDCAACAAKIEDAIRKIEGVHSVNINFLTGKMTLEADAERFEEVLRKSIHTGKKTDSEFSIIF